MSSMERIEIPAICRPVMALSRPEPGPLTRISISLTPNLRALSAQVSDARCAANGVLLREPLNPTVPALPQHRTSPLVSVIVTIVLLKVALMCATAFVTFLRTFFFLFALLPPLVVVFTVRSWLKLLSLTHSTAKTAADSLGDVSLNPASWPVSGQ